MKTTNTKKFVKKMYQEGFAAQGIVIITVILAVVLGSGYLVISRQNSSDKPNIVTEQTTPPTEPNGTPENTVNAVNEQLTEELRNEINALEAEDRQSDMDESTITDLEGAIDETSL